MQAKLLVIHILNNIAHFNEMFNTQLYKCEA